MHQKLAQLYAHGFCFKFAYTRAYIFMKVNEHKSTLALTSAFCVATPNLTCTHTHTLRTDEGDSCLHSTHQSPSARTLLCVAPLAFYAHTRTHTHIQTHHSSPLWCFSVDSWFNRIQRTMSRGYRRSGGERGEKPLSAPLPLWRRSMHRTHIHTLIFSLHTLKPQNYLKWNAINSRV